MTLPNVIQILSVNNNAITTALKADDSAFGLYLLLWKTLLTIRGKGS